MTSLNTEPSQQVRSLDPSKYTDALVGKTAPTSDREKSKGQVFFERLMRVQLMVGFALTAVSLALYRDYWFALSVFGGAAAMTANLWVMGYIVLGATQQGKAAKALVLGSSAKFVGLVAVFVLLISGFGLNAVGVALGSLSLFASICVGLILNLKA